MKTNESEEMYLETILLLKSRKPEVHSVDIVEELDYAKSSVSFAVHQLEDRGYITIDQSGAIELTASGEAKAQDVYERHRILTELLMRIGADRALAEENACRIEHVISGELFAVMKKYMEKN